MSRDIVKESVKLLDSSGNPITSDNRLPVGNQHDQPLTDTQLRASAVPISGVPENTVEYPIDEDAHDLQAAAFSQSSNIADDFVLDHILLNFTTTELRTITVSDSDGVVIRKVTDDDSLDYVLPIERTFKGSDNFTMDVTQTSAACVMDVKAVVIKGSVTTNLSGVRTADVNLKNVTIEPYGELLTAQKHTIIDLKSIYGFDDRLDLRDEENGGTVTHADAAFNLATNGNANAVARLESAQNTRYQSGTVGEGGVGVRRSSAPTGDIVWHAGLFDDQDGLYFGEDSTSLFIQRKRAGTKSAAVRQSNWNVDPLDGTGDSGYTLDLADGHILRIKYPWYGFGPIEWQVVMGSPQEVVTVHRERVTGETSLRNPHLPIAQEVLSTNTTDAFSLFVSGRQYSLIGDYRPRRLETMEERDQVTVSSTYIPIISLKRKAEFPTGVNNRVSVILNQLMLNTDNTIRWEIRQGMTLTNENFGSLSRIADSQTALESDVSATAASGGTYITGGMVAGGSRNSEELYADDFEFQPAKNQAITLIAKIIGNQDATVSASLFMLEER